MAGLDASVQLRLVKVVREAEGRGTVNWTIGYDTIFRIGIQWCPERGKSGSDFQLGEVLRSVSLYTVLRVC